jgi:hypothetical protein
VLEYPPGATSARHTDFDLFTLVAYRDPYPGGLVREEQMPTGGPFLSWADTISPGIHFGELFELGGFGAATPHEVKKVWGPFGEASWEGIPAAVSKPQVSAVYFALPAHDLVLPDGRKVGPQSEPGIYLHERMSRSRVYYDRDSGKVRE